MPTVPECSERIDVLPKVPGIAHKWWHFENVIILVNLKKHLMAISINMKNKVCGRNSITLSVKVMNSLKQYEKELEVILH